MILRSFLLIILFLTTVSFFWEDEEKKLRQLHQSAEIAMQGSDFKAAKEAYIELVDRIDIRPSKKYRVDWPTYIDIVIRLTHAYEAMNEIAEAKKTIEVLAALHPPPEFLARIQLIQVRLAARQKSPGRTYVEMKSVISNHPSEEWER